MEKLDGTVLATRQHPPNVNHSNTPKPKLKVDLFSNPQSFSNMIGNCGINKYRLDAEYPHFDIKYRTDNNLARDIYIAELK